MTTFKLKNDKVKNSDSYPGATQSIFNAITILPVIVLSLLLGFYLLVAIEFGHLPYYANPDPKDSLFAFLMTPVILGIMGTIATIPSWLLFILLHFKKKTFIPRLGMKIALYLLPVAVFLLLNAYSPVVVWLLD